MRLEDLIRGLEMVACSARPESDLTGIATDSRQVRPGDLFCALRGTAHDGGDFISEAVARGAAAVLTDDRTLVSERDASVVVKDVRNALAHISNRFYRTPSRDLVTVGVTGTNGKTTSTYLIRDILERAGLPCGLIGTVGYFIAGKKLPASHTTPDSAVLAQLLAQVRDAGGKAAVMEVSSHALDQQRADCIDFDTAVFTNLTRDHLDYHRDMQRYFQAKARLFTLLNASEKGRKTAVLNMDDPYSGALRPFIKTDVLTYGIAAGADIRAANIRCGMRGTEFDVVTRDGTHPVTSPLVGRFNVSNALAGIAAGISLRIPFPVLRETLGAFSPPPGRFQLVDEGQPFSVVVDYAHTDDALRNLLTTIREVAAGKIIVVFGCGGDRDRTKRPLMGQAAETLADYSIVTSDNPRSEDPLAIIADVRRGMKFAEGARSCVEPDRRKAVRLALKKAQAGDAVVIAGKGHEDYQIVGPATLHFSDVEVVRELLNEMKKAAPVPPGVKRADNHS